MPLAAGRTSSRRGRATGPRTALLFRPLLPGRDAAAEPSRSPRSQTPSVVQNRSAAADRLGGRPTVRDRPLSPNEYETAAPRRMDGARRGFFASGVGPNRRAARGPIPEPRGTLPRADRSAPRRDLPRRGRRDEPMIDVSPDDRDAPRDHAARSGSGPPHGLGGDRPSGRPRARHRRERALVAPGEPFHVEYRALHRDGRIVWIREESILVRDDDGTPLLLAGADARRHRADARPPRAPARPRRSTGRSWSRSRRSSTWTSRTSDMATTYVSPQIEAILGYHPAGVHRRPRPVGEHAPPGGPRRRRRDLPPRPRVGQAVRLRVPPDRTRRPRRLVPRLRDRAPGRGGTTAAHPGRDARHHRTQGRRGADRLPRVPRQAHGPAEPRDVRRAPRARARPRSAHRPRRRRGLRRPRRLQARERLARPRGRRRARSCSSRNDCATRRARPTSWRDPAATSSCCCSPTSTGRRRCQAAQDGVAIAAESVAVRIQQALQAAVPASADTELYLTASVGISVFPHDADDAVELLKNADTAMFRSKKAGPGGYLVHTADDADAMTRLSLSTRLRTGRRAGAVDAPLPAVDRAHDRRDVRRRGADPVARAERRARAAGRVHPARRGDGADRGDRRLGGRGDLPPGCDVASRGPRRSRWASTCRRASSGSPSSSTGSCRRS